jgi:predicted acyltransferase
LDALRGFDMFWILGADALVYALDRLSKSASATPEPSSGIASFLAYELKHAEWVGFHFYDLIFPLFVFIVGVSLVFSLQRMVETVGRAEAVKRVIRRGILLYVIGLLYSGGISDGWDNIRWMGVLNRIAICYLCTGLLYLFCNLRAMITVCVGLLIGYWAIMTFVPIRNIQLEKTALQELSKKTGIDDPHVLFNNTTDRVTGHFEHGFNLANHFDFQYLPGKKYDTYFDPEGYLSNIPAIATCLLGVFAAFLLRAPKLLDQQKLIYLVTAGLVGASLGWAWHMQFPVIKKIWTSSYVLVAGGYSALLLAAFYFVVDILKFQVWCRPFIWVGMNPITLYLTSNIIGGFRKPAQRFVGGDVTAYLDQHIAKGTGDLLVATVGLLLLFWFAHFLYKRKIFLRL